jgi:hypothetical protein
MKTIYALTATAALMIGFGTASIASETIVFQGCEMTRASNGNYLFKADPGCVFGGFGNDGTVAGVGVTDAPAEDADE